VTPRVLVLTPDFPPERGGVQTLVHRVAAGWSRLEPIVVAPAAPGATRFDAGQPFDVHRVRLPRFLPRAGQVAVFDASAFAYGLALRPSSILSAHVVTSPAAVSAARVVGATWVQYLHGKEIVRRPRLTRFAMAHADAVVAVSRYTERMAAAAGADARRLHRIPPGVDLPTGVPAHRNGGPPTIAVVARLADEYKGHDVLLGALGRLRHSLPAVKLIVIGDGPLLSRYEALAAELGIAAAVDFVGAVDDDERDRLLDRATVFAMPSRLAADGSGEGFGIVYLEAASRGLPIVAGNVAGARDAVVNGETGLLVDPTDEVAVAAALEQLLTDRDRASALGAAGAARAKRFAWTEISRRVEDVVLGTLEAGR